MTYLGVEIMFDGESAPQIASRLREIAEDMERGYTQGSGWNLQEHTDDLDDEEPK